MNTQFTPQHNERAVDHQTQSSANRRQNCRLPLHDPNCISVARQGQIEDLNRGHEKPAMREVRDHGGRQLGLDLVPARVHGALGLERQGTEANAVAVS